MKSINGFENFKVENLKYFTGGGSSTGGGEKCNSDGSCSSFSGDYVYNDGEKVYLNETTVKKEC